MQNIAILGSTGSIGKQTLEVIAANPEKYKVTVLAAYHNDQLLEKQIACFKPDIAVLAEESAAKRLKERYNGNTCILCGEEALIEAATFHKVDTVLTSLVGFAGLKPTVAAIKAGKNIALANKETLVAAGSLVMSIAREKGVHILPVDSEHSAVMQCLQGENPQDIQKIILTASGGPFRGFKNAQLENVTVSDCLKHPNWSMGQKITIDSATMVNKGLEVIEAKWLFNVNYEDIEVIIQPQSIIHSMVEFKDGSVIAQLGKPDMRIPIQYALSYPERWPSRFPKLDFTQLHSITFEKPDYETFRGLKLAFAAGCTGGTMPCVLNAANEIAVYAFLQKRIKFMDIAAIIEATMDNHTTVLKPDLDALYEADFWARSEAKRIIGI